MRSILETDGYKFSMAEAGFPLRQETFYYSHRKGGWQFLPIDIEEFVKANLPEPTEADYAYLDKHGYTQGGAFRQAIKLRDQITVKALPVGSWFYEREPVFSITGPSALVSWLEPVLLRLNFIIQIATRTAFHNGSLGTQRVTCTAEAELFASTIDCTSHLQGCNPPKINFVMASIEYTDAVYTRARDLINAVGGDANRLFEVGMRAVSCSEQHEIALRAIQAAGILRTSNVGLACALGMIPVGTMGHEHVQRHGDDYTAYTAMRDRFPGFIFYLPDTFDTIGSGIPNALRAMQDDPTRDSGIRFDSEHGVRGHYLFAVARAREARLAPFLGLESGWDLDKTVEFEKLRELVDWPAARQGYGYGGYLVKPPWPTFNRDDVSAVWKISQSGSSAVMKFGDEPGGGKESIPGRPVVWRSHRIDPYNPVGYIAQEGEDWSPPVPADLLSGASKIPRQVHFGRNDIFNASLLVPRKSAYSPATQALVDACRVKRIANIRNATG